MERVVTVLMCVLVVGVLTLVLPDNGNAVSGLVRCHGSVSLDGGHSRPGRSAARNINCKDGKRAIKAPASDLGYSCVQGRPVGSGSVIRCRKGSVFLKFIYMTD